MTIHFWDRWYSYIRTFNIREFINHFSFRKEDEYPKPPPTIRGVMFGGVQIGNINGKSATYRHMAPLDTMKCYLEFDDGNICLGPPTLVDYDDDAIVIHWRTKINRGGILSKYLIYTEAAGWNEHDFSPTHHTMSGDSVTITYKLKIP